MGYQTVFDGEFKLNKPLKKKQIEYLKKFAETRRMKRNSIETEKLPDPVRKAVKLPIGVEGGYFVGDTEDFGQGRTPDIIDYNSPPNGQPGLWNQWVPNEDGTAITWDGGEKFYSYVEWLRYIIGHFLAPWGYVLNGEVTWSGEEQGDVGIIICKNNKVAVKHGKIVYE